MSGEHKSYDQSRKSFEDRIRSTTPGTDRETAKRIAEKSARDLHDKLDKRR